MSAAQADVLKQIRDVIDDHYQNGAAHDRDEDNNVLGEWRIFNLSDAYEERPPLQYLISDVLYYPSLSIVYGGPGSLKSMLLTDLMACVVAGAVWLPSGAEPGKSFAAQKAAALWIDFDNGTRRTHEHFEAAGRAYSLPPDAPLHYVSMPRPWLDLTKSSMVEGLRKHLLRLGAKLLIIDNLGLVIGDADENSGEMAQVMGNLRWLCEQAECAVIIVHHQRKSNGGADNGVRKGDSLRGHSSIEASLDLALLVERRDGEDDITVYPTKVRGYRAFEFFGATFTYQHKEGTRDLQSVRFFSKQILTKAEREENELKAAILTEIMAKPGIEQKALVDAVRDSVAALTGKNPPGINKVRGTVTKMAAEGAIRSQGEKGKAIKYWLVS